MMASIYPSQRSRKLASGFTLVEVLVAAFVLGVGLLGVATMQMTSLKNNNSAALRTQAVFLGQDIADRMRANPAGVAAGAYDTAPTCPSGCKPEIPDRSSCSTVEIDGCDWEFASESLPGGQYQLTQLDAANNIYQARIMWDDQRTGVTGTGCDPDDPNDLLCFDLQFRP